MAEASLDDQPQNKRHFHSLFIRCSGKHDEKKHYTAVGLQQSQEKKDARIILYMLIVDENTEQVTVIEHDSENAILQCSGGLFDPNGNMTVIDPMRKSMTGTLNNCRMDFTIYERPARDIK